MMRRTTVLAMSALLVCVGCGSDDNDDPEQVAGLPITPLASPDPTDFVSGVDNPWLPLTPGNLWVYQSRGEDDTRIVTTVTHRTRVVQGVTCVVVHDVETAPDGEVLEDTYDWYAQDKDGNVWYFGEDTTAYDEGAPTKEGSWEAGVEGAQAGIVMLAAPEAGDSYYQEFWEGEAEDQGKVLDVEGTHPDVDASYGPLLIMADTTPLEPRLIEHKYYAPGVGVVREETVRGGREVVVLVTAQT